MFNDELHLLHVNPWADRWLLRPLYRGDVAKRGNIVPIIAEFAILPAHQAAEEATSWFYGKPSPDVLEGLRAALLAHPAWGAPGLSSARYLLSC